MVVNNSNQYLPGTIQIPSSINIISITQSFPMVITIDVNPDVEANTYIPGQVVKLFIPQTYKMIQANGLTGKILSVLGSDLSVEIDSSLFDAFVVPSGNVLQPASISPNGSRNLEFNNNTRQVPFQSLNNRGN